MEKVLLYNYAETVQPAIDWNIAAAAKVNKGIAALRKIRPKQRYSDFELEQFFRGDMRLVDRVVAEEAAAYRGGLAQEFDKVAREFTPKQPIVGEDMPQYWHVFNGKAKVALAESKRMAKDYYSVWAYNEAQLLLWKHLTNLCGSLMSVQRGILAKAGAGARLIASTNADDALIHSDAQGRDYYPNRAAVEAILPRLRSVQT